MKTLIQKWLLLAPLGLILLLTGCDSTGTDGNQANLSLSFVAKNSSQTAQKIFQNDHVTISEAKMLIRRIKFKNDLEDDGIADDSLDFYTDPMVVILNLDGNVNELAVTEVQTGSYDEIEFDVHKPEDMETPPDPDFRIGDSGDERFSIIISGSYNGEDFTYRSNENMEQELELATPLIITEDSNNINVTLTVDLSNWFLDENGNQLDPTDPDNVSAIDDSIERSFENVFEDNDHDGEED